MTEESPRPQRPTVVPEIIPPNRHPHPPARRGAEFTPFGGTHRIYVTRLGPFGGILLMLALIVFAAVMFVAFLGALILWIPLVIFIALVAALSGFLRFRRR